MISTIDWPTSYRLIRAHYPSVDIFEQLVPPEDLPALLAIEALTNPRLRDTSGPIAAIPVADRVTGPGTKYIMAAFAYPGDSRFSDTTAGAYYAAHDLETAIAEVSHHRAAFARTTPAHAQEFDERVIEAHIAGDFEDIRTVPSSDPRYGAEYSTAQAFARDVRARGDNGIVYHSVRHLGGECIAVYVPRLIKNARTTRYLGMRWDGDKIKDVYEKASLMTTYPP